MSGRIRPPSPEPVLARLKGFQRDTAEYAFQQLYLAPDSTHRFLVADEVGLGKTLVARGVVAQTVEHLWDQVERIDIVYICSNANIARQNIRRLSLPGYPAFENASRITLLPTELHNLSDNKVNLISFTPGTSFHLAGGGGRMDERILLYWLLHDLWDFGNNAAPKNIFQGWVTKKDRFRRKLQRFRSEKTYDRSLATMFRKAVRRRIKDERKDGKDDLYSRFESLCESFGYARKHIPKEESRERDRWIGELRTILAQTCLAALEPDLVILDEFQRFRDLLDGDEPAAELARDLFNYADDTTEVRTLLLSATPYKMYTLAHELGEDNHYEDFLRTVKFLNGKREEPEILSGLLKRYRREIFALGQGGGDGLAEVKGAVERELRRVMARTERLRVSDAGDGMLKEIPAHSVKLHPKDVQGFVHLQKIANALGHSDVIEYWKSSPYLLNFMDDYKLKQALVDRVEGGGEDRELRRLIGSSADFLLSWEDVEEYAEVDPGNARLRGLWEDTLANNAWQLLWLPPTAPYYQLEEPFRSAAMAGITKRLVFSAWKVVPRVIATLTSYEAERRTFQRFEADPENTTEARERKALLLTFTRSQGRLTGMPVLGLLYPSPTLAELGDTLHARAGLEADAPGLEEILHVVQGRIRPELDAITKGAPSSGPEDESWYWAAPILLDLQRFHESTVDWFDREDLASIWSGVDSNAETASARWEDHVDEAGLLVEAEHRLGRPPDDLLEVVSLLAIAGPATAALRAFRRAGHGSVDPSNVEVRDAAGRTGWAFRRLFNQLEAMAILRAGHEDLPYWRRVLEYGAAGCLPAVMDEYVHLLRDSLGLFDVEGPELATALADGMGPVIGPRPSLLQLDEIRVDGGELSLQKRNLRARFALRFGKEKSDGEKDVLREDAVRAAFNSPFWPFVLATTSVGQEGLDFHSYCHAVVHWNLPANPVDLEQREGRVHRFKGHAIRKNVAARHAEAAFIEAPRDPWERMFELATAAANADDGGLSPYWVYPLEGGAYVERHVPALPLSRDRPHLEALRRSLAIYRMVFGQPRQDDLMAYLLERVSPEVLEEHRDLLRVDLTPPRKR